MAKEPILSAKDVEIQFSVRGRKLMAIRKCSLDLYEGETLAIVGESGSGKSVFTKSFIGMLDANGTITGGSITYNGVDISKYKTEDGHAGPDDLPEPAEENRQTDSGKHRASPGTQG